MSDWEKVQKIEEVGQGYGELKSQVNWRLQLPLCGTQCLTEKFSENRGFWKAKQAFTNIFDKLFDMLMLASSDWNYNVYIIMSFDFPFVRLFGVR
jgi:hypothetical protein